MEAHIYAGLLAVALTLTIGTESFWTDEAFSGLIPSHRTVASTWHTLVTGDSSDLQMLFYYFFMHAWSTIFGLSETAFRSANIPFPALFRRSGLGQPPIVSI